jgi:crossover junction endodeoxyribonuclease RusA
MNSYELVLPLGPSDNHYYGQHGHRKYIKPAGVAFRQEVALAVRLAKLPKMEGDLCMVVRVYAKTKHKLFDPLNRAKALCDALTHAGLMEDDSQLKDSRFIYGGVSPPGRIEVLIGELYAS